MTLTDAERERLANMRDACQAAIDGNPWEVQNTVGEWRSPEPGSGLPMTYWRARAKPWSLPPPPEGGQWHRQDFTESMLPPVTDGGLPWRPLMLHEKQEAGDFWFGDTEWKEVRGFNVGDESKAHCMHRRTRRPSAPVVRDWNCAADVPRPICFVIGDKCKCPQLVTMAEHDGVWVSDGSFYPWSHLKAYSTTRTTWRPCQTPDPRA